MRMPRRCSIIPTTKSNLCGGEGAFSTNKHARRPRTIISAPSTTTHSNILNPTSARTSSFFLIPCTSYSFTTPPDRHSSQPQHRHSRHDPSNCRVPAIYRLKFALIPQTYQYDRNPTKRKICSRGSQKEEPASCERRVLARRDEGHLYVDEEERKGDRETDGDDESDERDEENSRSHGYCFHELYGFMAE
jgi:hypothetical protein